MIQMLTDYICLSLQSLCICFLFLAWPRPHQPCSRTNPGHSSAREKHPSDFSWPLPQCRMDSTTCPATSTRWEADHLPSSSCSFSCADALSACSSDGIQVYLKYSKYSLCYKHITISPQAFLLSSSVSSKDSRTLSSLFPVPKEISMCFRQAKIN